MQWVEAYPWKIGIIIAAVLVLLVLLMWIPMSAAYAYKGTSGPATPITETVQATPTVDATVATLNKEKLEQEVQHLKNQNSLDLLDWLQTNSAILITTLVIVIGGLIGLFRWFEDRRSEQGKRDEDRFQTTIERLGSTNQATQVGAAITLRTFLDSDYARFYNQTFDLAVAHLRLRKIDPNKAEPLDSLSQALITVFKESISKVRPRLRWINGKWPKNYKNAEQLLNAAKIQLDTAYLAEADLQYAWMPQASLREANLYKADLRYATLKNADLSRADLRKAQLFQADLTGANLIGANLIGAELISTDLVGTDLRYADLRYANLGAAPLREANLSYADLRHATLEPEAHYVDTFPFVFFLPTMYRVEIGHLDEAIFYKADLREARLIEANLDDALTLQGTDLRGVHGLTQKQLEACKARGAIIDDAPETSSSSLPVLPPLPLKSGDIPAQSSLTIQGSTSLPDTDGSSAAFFQQDTES